MTDMRISAKTAVVLLAAAIVVVAALGLARLPRHGEPPPPRPCASPALPSGDQLLRHGVIWTCTDGFWHTR